MLDWKATQSAVLQTRKHAKTNQRNTGIIFKQFFSFIQLNIDTMRCVFLIEGWDNEWQRRGRGHCVETRDETSFPAWREMCGILRSRRRERRWQWRCFITIIMYITVDGRDPDGFRLVDLIITVTAAVRSKVRIEVNPGHVMQSNEVPHSTAGDVLVVRSFTFHLFFSLSFSLYLPIENTLLCMSWTEFDKAEWGVQTPFGIQMKN